MLERKCTYHTTKQDMHDYCIRRCNIEQNTISPFITNITVYHQYHHLSLLISPVRISLYSIYCSNCTNLPLLPVAIFTYLCNNMAAAFHCHGHATALLPRPPYRRINSSQLHSKTFPNSCYSKRNR